MRSAALGVWVGVGSRDETPSEAGAWHFLEHLLFKGTARRDALEIASVMDAVGGELNAFTATSTPATTPGPRRRPAAGGRRGVRPGDLGAGRAEDVESERGVILEEISMHDDDPGDVVHDAFAEALYGDHPLGRPVIGSVGGHPGPVRDRDRGLLPVSLRLPSLVVSATGNSTTTP